MRVKRFVVDSMPDALQKIRNDLGRDAVILNTKEIRSGGIFGLFSRKQIEVIAASDDNARQEQENRATVATLDRPAPPQPSPEKVNALATEQITAEIQQMKDMMYKLLEQGSEAVKQELEHFKTIEERLRRHEFDPHLIQHIMHGVMQATDKPLADLTSEELLALTKAELRALIPEQKVSAIAEGTKLVHIVGPTGVGKTTTIAKLAAEKVLKEQKKVGFITSDTYRIAAVEQLKTYGTILNVPLEVVSSPQDLTRSLERLKDCDIIFMDTAGRNFRNEMYVSELNSLLQTYDNCETFLTLSLTMKYRDMEAVTRNFAKFNLDKVLFTKKDETDSYGSIFNIAHQFSLKLSYITDGQNVPDDIETIDIDSIITTILEEQDNE